MAIEPTAAAQLPTACMKRRTMRALILFTLENDVRKLYLHCQGREGAISAAILLPESSSVSMIVVDGKEAAPSTGSTPYRYLVYKGLGKEGFDLVFETSSRSPLDCSLVDRSMGLPEVPGFNTAYPANVIPGPDYNSNTIQVMKHYRF